MSDVLMEALNVSKTYTLWRNPINRLTAPGLRALAEKTSWLSPVSQWANRKADQIARPFTALQPISLRLSRGESLGIVGRNGSGKSTLLQILAGTLMPSTGTVNCRGRIAALLELGSGFNLEFSGRENVYLQGSIYGLSSDQMDRHFEEVAAFAEIGEFMEQPVKTYSSGMMVRLAFAVQVVLRPDILIVDEALSVGDVFFQAKCSAYFQERLAEGMSLILVSHDLVTLKALCRKAVVLHKGAVRFSGDSAAAVSIYHEVHQSETIESLRTASAPAGTAAQPRPVAVRRSWKSTDEIGGREAEMIAVEVLDAGGTERQQFAPGEDIVVRIHVRASTDVPVLHAGIQLVDRHNRALYGTSTQHLDERPATLRSGQQTAIEFKLPGRLGAGAYLFDAVLGWGQRWDGAFTHQCHRVGGIASITVVDTGSKPRHLGPVDLAAESRWLSLA